MWLPIPATEIDGLPDAFEYRFWEGGEFPADP
ncbi:dihydrofolate reductase, partial [Streptomyces sp. OF3]|nr:dihydrofolate reductase [Streptomyces alkaliterrae]